MEKDSATCSKISRTSGSSKSSCSGSDDSIDDTVPKGVKSSQPQKRSKANEYHSDPSHDRHPSRQPNTSNESCSGRDISHQSIKRKLTSTESRGHRKSVHCSVSNDERVSHSYNADHYKVAVNNSKAVRAVNNSFSSSLMIESLIDQICKMMIRGAKDQQNMYKSKSAFCKDYEVYLYQIGFNE